LQTLGVTRQADRRLGQNGEKLSAGHVGLTSI